jgi:hypothetical protein
MTAMVFLRIEPVENMSTRHGIYAAVSSSKSCRGDSPPKRDIGNKTKNDRGAHAPRPTCQRRPSRQRYRPRITSP